MKTITAILIALTAAAHAGPRTSASYSIATDTTDAGGKRATSASYTNDASAGGIAGLSTVAAPAETAKSGYLGQLFEVTGLTLTAVSLNVNEDTTDQLAAWQALDDASFLAVPAASVAWSVQSGPLTGISAAGVATAGIVYQDTAATAQGIFSGNTGTLGLTVKNVNLDDFGSYAGDGLDDGWQNQYFGLDNPLAAPGADADGDGQNNVLEFRAGYVPTDPASRFTTRPVSLNAGTFTLELSRVQPGTRYVFERTTDFAAWTDVFTLDPAAVAAPHAQPLPAVGGQSVFRVRLEAAP